MTGLDYLKREDSEIVKLSGPDGLDLLHRISTNDLSMLQDGEHKETILTTEKGRIVDIVSVVRMDAETVLLIPSSPRAKAVKEWIEKFIIMENVTASEEKGYVHYLLTGEALGSGKPSDWVYFAVDSGNTRIGHFLVPREGEEQFKALLGERGGRQMDPTEYQDFRIRAGMPEWPTEISSEVNPLEAGMGSLVSWTKGCYIGQEVISRLDTYKKVQKHLAQFDLDARPEILPVPIVSQGVEIGVLTSVTSRPGYAGLGYLRTGHESDTMALGRSGVEIPLRRRK